MATTHQATDSLKDKFAVYKTQARMKIQQGRQTIQDLRTQLSTEAKAVQTAMQDKTIELLRLDASKLKVEKELALSKQENAKNQKCIDAQKKLIEGLQADLKAYREAEWKATPTAPAPSTPIHETELDKNVETEVSTSDLFAPLPAQLERPPRTTKDAIRAGASNKRKLKQAFHCRCAKPVTVTCAEKGCERGHCGKPFCAGFKDAKAMKKQPWVCNHHSEICEVRCASINENGRACDKILDDRNHEYVINAVACSCQGCIKDEDAKCTKSWSCWECAEYDGEANHFIFPGHVFKKTKKLT